MTELEIFFDSYYRLRPVNATFTGVHDFDGRLPDWSPDGLDAAVDEMRNLRAALSRHATPAPLTEVEHRDRELAIAFLDIQIAEYAGRHFQRGNPSLALGEAGFGVIALITRPFADGETRARAVVERLTAIPAFLDGARRACTNAVPEEWRRRCLRECDGVDRLFGGGLEVWIALESLSAVRGAQLAQAGREALMAIDGYRHWLLHDVRSADAQAYGAGPELFDLLLRRGHWCDRPREDLAREARAALDEALCRLSDRAAAAPGGWPEVQRRLAGAHPPAGDYLVTYQRIWERCRRFCEDHHLVTWPDYPIRYVPIPRQTRDAAPFLYYLFYRSPAPYDCLPLHDYVVTAIDDRLEADEQLRRLRANNTAVITLNHVIHHGAIGHHVQNYYAYHGASEIGRVAAVDCASRIGMFAGGSMAEGWACYATDLMDEYGFLTSDQALSLQHTRARLLARAVVDAGLHEGSLTFDEAVALYRDRIGMPDLAARAEVCKNSMFPATAIMYWLGTAGLHALRQERAGALPLREFHDRVLSYGSIPVALVAQVWK